MARPTHFLSLPLHSSHLSTLYSSLTQRWLSSPRTIEGFDPSLLAEPQRLHLTIGVFTLTKEQTEGKKSVADALRALNVLGEGNDLVGMQGVRIRLGKLDTFRRSQCHVLYVKPECEDGRLMRLADIIRQHFLSHGFQFSDGDRPLTLHLTLLNTSYRRDPTDTREKGKRKKHKKRIPFDPLPFLHPEEEFTPQEARVQLKKEGVDSGLGEHVLESIQLCSMGSRDEEGRYVALGEIKL